jgi:hypothetical protein
VQNRRRVRWLVLHSRRTYKHIVMPIKTCSSRISYSVISASQQKDSITKPMTRDSHYKITRRWS